MTIVLVHGNPETDALWGPLVDALGRDDVLRLSPPGFGAPLPEGFSATYLAYRDWLEDQLEGIDGPVDLVGHDFGGIHAINAVMHRPALVRSWVSDVLGVFDPNYEWHDLAQVWQTPGEGEQLIESFLGGTPEERATVYATAGMPMDVGTAIARGQGPEMGRAILRLYRSAGDGASGTRLGEGSAPAWSLTPGHRRHLRRIRRNSSSRRRSCRCAHRGPRRIGALVDGGGPRPWRRGSHPILG